MIIGLDKYQSNRVHRVTENPNWFLNEKNPKKKKTMEEFRPVHLEGGGGGYVGQMAVSLVQLPGPKTAHFSPQSNNRRE